MTCKYPNCDRDTQDETGFDGRFCSKEHAIKYDHLKADADEARYEEERQTASVDHTATGSVFNL